MADENYLPRMRQRITQLEAQLKKDEESYETLVQEAEAMEAYIPKLQAEIERLREALDEISELTPDHTDEAYSIEGALETCIHIAQQALNPQEA